MENFELMYDFNMLVSHQPGSYRMARDEIKRVLDRLGDGDPKVSRTFARGIIGVKTSLDSRKIIQEVRRMFSEDPWCIQFTLKWVPIDVWTRSDIESIKKEVKQLRRMISEGDKWRMTVEKRRYVKHHKIDIIKPIAELINHKVDLENPDKILRIDVIGKYSGISILKPDEVFSVAKP